MTHTTYPEFTPNALSILDQRYLRNGETPDQLFRRLAKAVAKGEPENIRKRMEEQFYNLTRSLRFLPNSPALVNAGVERAGSLSACYTITPRDDMDSIMQIGRDAAMIEKSGGGVGFGLSNLRPRNDIIKSIHGNACGPIAVMKMYSAIGATLTQGAFREGAHMGQLDVTHPDIREFIHCKDGDDTLANFNISVQVSDEFMRAVESGGAVELLNPRDTGDGPENRPAGAIDARELWEEIVESAHKTGDPGIVFMDRVHETAPNPQMGPIETSNPCSEEFMENYGNCCLGSIDLSRHVHMSDERPILTVNWELLENTIRTAVRFLDDVTTVNTFPIEKLREVNLATRRIGLGVMGWADMLAAFAIPYDSDDAIELADTLARFIHDTAWDESESLATERGPYPEYERSALRDRGMPPVRNSSVVTIAPTGTISRLAGCSSGIEPHFSLVYRSHVLWKRGEAGTTLLDAPAPLIENIRQKTDRDLQEVLAELYNNPAQVAEYTDPAIFRTSHDVTPEDHIRMQAAWQKWVTNGVSKTINMPNSATASDVADAYMKAWKTNCKAVSIYRDGSKSQQVLETAETAAMREDGPKTKNGYVTPENRPRRLHGQTDRIETGSGRLYVTINEHNGRMFEVFMNLGKPAPTEQAHLEAVSRLISLSLRAGIHPGDIIDQLAGITTTPTWDEGTLVLSPEDGASKLMDKWFETMDKADAATDEKDTQAEDMSDMSAALAAEMTCRQVGCSGITIYAEGCETCQTCGHSKCD